MKAHLMSRAGLPTKGLRRPAISLSGISGAGNAYRCWQWLADHEPLTGPILSRAVARCHGRQRSECWHGMHCRHADGPVRQASSPARLYRGERGFDDEALVDALFTAGGIGAVIIRRASVSGAAGGCQAETGSAAAMAAGAATELLGGSPAAAAAQAVVAVTLKNMLGLVCDPVAGLVEVPCVKRNRQPAQPQCFIAVDLALAGVESVIPP